VGIGRPHRVGDTVEFRCEYLIVGLAKPKRFHAAGVDEFQALALALPIVGVHLETSPEGKAGRLTFAGGSNLRFPPLQGAG
jgi:hypothetical protein